LGTIVSLAIVAAFLVRRMKLKTLPRVSPALNSLPRMNESTVTIVELAHKQGAAEFEPPLTLDELGLDVKRVVGAPAQLSVSFHEQLPFIGLNVEFPVETELAFIVRRLGCTLDLPRIVDNTPIPSARIEYRLRKMTLDDSISERFQAGSNRPRLFRLLMGNALAHVLADGLTNSRYRLEDLVFDGKSIVCIVQPAMDPLHGPFVTDTLNYLMPVVSAIHTFVSETPCNRVE